MRKVLIHTHLPDCEADAVFTALHDFSAYPEYCQSVRAVQVQPLDDHQALSAWEVNFQNGILKWQERDRFDPEQRRIQFEQFEGDIEHFSGCWQVCPKNHGSLLIFEAQFDLGIPMLADMLDPIAQQAIEENIRSIIHGLFFVRRTEAGRAP
ncbi:SRPBCC family protein [Pseudomonas sessilinigenes]|uniref:SRPBCC family protein n=1 Tax=Pseudomonas sessilinigenes TaxID=658629 RepID=A0ABX8MJS2_9PSED|nr:SRPBCC family protein [Pseudomonas sessilinigenes]AZC26524.1 hypothetical protein C4K39_4879 [Pseudomonas sessilinigenes]QXH39470.1 SRPBCC family protein [Pseudomonas sessilinigenes]